MTLTIFIKSILAGVAALVVSSILLVAISTLMFFVQVRRAGSGGIGATSVAIGPTFWILAVLIFAAGFWWEFRRASNRPTTLR